MARSEKSFFENEYVVQLLAAMKEQTLLCNEILKEKRASKPSVKETSGHDGSLKFTQKEIKSMPSLKDCKIRFHNNIYEIRYRKYGFDKSFAHKKLDIAKEKARKFLATVDEKFYAVSKIKTANTQTVTKSVNAAKYCEDWLKNVKARKVKPVSFKALYSRFTTHLQPVLKKYTLKTLSAPVLQKIFDSVSTKNGEEIRTILNGMFEYAIANGLIDRSPMSVVIIQKHERINGERLTRKQEEKLLQTIKGSEYETAIKLYLYTGARPSELKSIKFDWNKGTFSLQNSKLKSYQKEQTRTLPIFSTLFAIKDEILTIDTTKINSTYLGRYFNSLGSGYQVKTLRHTFTSKCKEQGVLPELVNYWTGHAIGSDTSAKIYTHFEMEFQKKEAEKITW
ncbi:MAG: hypothetical protein IJU84_01515 [Clostridia bacterium]|nr:hypothetical protein [Clostridia bacterium]